MVTSKKIRKNAIRKRREERKKNPTKLPEGCLRCSKPLMLSYTVHHHFCNKCWSEIYAKYWETEGDSRWCFICGKNIENSPYAYLCEKHGEKIEKYGGKKLTRKRNVNNYIPFDFFGLKI